MIIPSVEEVRRFIKSELQKIQSRGYSPEQIHACIVAYGNRESAYDDLVKKFATQIQSAPKIANFVHSVRVRLKDPYSLADKLVRKCLDKHKPRNITTANFFNPKEGVTDLGAVRILHLRRDEWKHLHDYLVDRHSMVGLSIEEKTAYARRELWDEYSRDGRFTRDPDETKSEIKFDEEKGYTSLHYVIRGYHPVHGELYIECQIRTLFEEGWGEIDHQTNYPYRANSITRGYLSNLNSTANTANEIASKLDTLSQIPLFVRWDTEQQLERSADKVYCVTPDLKWVAENLDKFVANVKDSGGTFQYFILKDDGDTIKNFERTKNRLESEGLLNKKVWLKRVQRDKSAVPVIADLLLLENASDPVSRQERHISVVGAPAQRVVSQEDHLDMLITDDSAVERMRRFFEQLQ